MGNHFFYLLAEGSGAKTIGGVAHSSPDLQRLDGDRHRPGRRREDLVPRADGLHDLGHDLRRARTATLNAARDLYGAGCTQYNTVAAAWSAVAVG